MNTPIWTSTPIRISDDLSLTVSVSAEGVTFGKTSDGVYASDLLLTDKQTDLLAIALLTALRVRERLNK